MPAATFDACNYKQNRQETKKNEENLEKKPTRSNINKISN